MGVRTGWGGVGGEIGCLDLCLGLSVSRDCTVSSSGDSASRPRPRAALGNFGRNPPLSSRRGPSTQKPGRCPFGLGRGVWHREQVGPALPVCDSFLFIINLGDSPRHRRVSNGQLFERLGVRPLHVICLGVCFQIWPLQETHQMQTFFLPDLRVPDLRAGIFGFIVQAYVSFLLKGLLRGVSSGPTLSTDF